MRETNNEEDLTGLKNKVNELHALLKLEKARAEKAEREKEEATEAATTANSTELEKMTKRAEKAERDLNTALEQADASGKSLREYKRDAAIANVITANKVNPDDARAVRALILTELDADGDEPTVGGQALNDYAKTFFAKEGQRYILAADHNGGGATGSDNTKASRMTKENFNFTEFAKIQLADPAEANAIADAVGRPNLKVQL